MKRTLAVFLLLLLTSIGSLSAQVADGDALYANRAEGADGAVAKATKIDAAIAAYRRVSAGSESLEPRWKLMRALRFKGAYVAPHKEAKKAVFAEAKKVGAEAMSIRERQLRARGVSSMTKASEKQIANAARPIPHAAQVIYWDAVNWGEWALVYGKMAAVKEGAADRIKRQATIVNLIDPKIENGGGARVLGRLHNQTPRVPFLTGWASDAEAVRFLRQSLAQDPENKLTKVFLAEAMVAADRKTRSQAVGMLREVLSSPNDPAYVVEDVAAKRDAGELLASWGEK